MHNLEDISYDVQTVVAVNLLDVVDGLSQEQALALIKHIDLRQEDWDFTEAAAEYFNSEMAKLKGMEKEDTQTIDLKGAEFVTLVSYCGVPHGKVGKCVTFGMNWVELDIEGFRGADGRNTYTYNFSNGGTLRQSENEVFLLKGD